MNIEQRRAAEAARIQQNNNRKRQNQRYDRRQFLAAAGTVVSGLIVLPWARSSWDSATEPIPTLPPVVTPEAAATPVPPPHERGSNKDLLSIQEENGIWLSRQEIELIEKNWNRFSLLEPFNKIKIVKEGSLSSVDNEGIRFSAELFSDDPRMDNRQGIEIPLAILMSIPKKITIDSIDEQKSDYKKEKAWFDFRQQYETSIRPYIPKPDSPSSYVLNNGIDLFNAYHNFPTFYEDDKQRARLLLQNPNGYFASAATAMALRMNDLTQEILEMPVNVYSGTMGGSGYVSSDSIERGIAKSTFDNTYKLLKACAQKRGKNRGDGALHHEVSSMLQDPDTNNYSISTARYELGFRT